MSQIFVKFGGHALAAGLTLRRENLPLLDEGLNKFARGSLKKTGQKPILNIDFELPVRYINVTLPTELELLEPCGPGNPAPIFSVSGCKVVNTRMLSDGKHLRLTVEKDGKLINAIAFGMGADYNLLIPGDHIDISGNVNLNTWNGNTQIQFVVQDMRYSEIANDVTPVPCREDFKILYTLLKRSAKNGIVKLNKEFLLRKLQVSEKGDFNFEKLVLCLDVMAEQHLLTYVDEGTGFDIFLLETTGKTDIMSSKLLTDYKNKVSD
jgi:single-stranded-DNA-specific exonuclease